ncbi:hypothetical protein K1719_018808 [Acacia pycnantha]|nr:hypothetical protein K1719_018808 [Acacia pycnantha]
MTKNILSLLPYLLLIQICSTRFDDIAVYLRQYSVEGSLKETCATGKYSFVVINPSTHQHNLTGHCDPFSSSGCTTVGSEIKYCQQQGIKVMLSISLERLSLNHTLFDDAQKAFDYLWNKFLGGSSSSRPFGDAILDGIDFYLSEATQYFNDLASILKSHSTDTQKLYLSAAPQCSHFEAFYVTYLLTGGFDYVWVQFFNNSNCEYSQANTTIQFFRAWEQWETTYSVTKSKLFLGLPASQETSISGYVPADLLISEVLPTINKSPIYGGVMLWTSYEDRLSGYSTYLQLCTKPQSAPECRNHDNGFEERLGYTSGGSIKVYESVNLGGQCCETICWNDCSCEAYAPLNQVNNTGCQIWLKGSKFIEDAGSKG